MNTTLHNSDQFVRFVASRIRDLRKQKNLSQSELSEMVSLSRVSIANIELGHQKPTLELVWKLSSAFSIEVHYFFPTESDILSSTGKKSTADFLKDLESGLT